MNSSQNLAGCLVLLAGVCVFLRADGVSAYFPRGQQELGLRRSGNDGGSGHNGSGAEQPTGNAPPWCQQPPSARTQWHTVIAPPRTVLSKQDVHTCSIMRLPVLFDPDLVYTRTALQVADSQPAVQLYQLLLLDCDAQFWQLSGIQEQEHMCLENTAALRASCNQWLLTPPVAGKNSSVACAPPHTAFGRSGDLAKRILVLQAHWRMSSDAVAAAPAVQLPQVKLQLGAAPAVALDGRYNSAAASQPALLGSFVGSGVYPPSSLSHSLQAFTLQQSEMPGISTAALGCGKRCTYLPLGRIQPKPVTVVGYSFSTFDRAVAVSVEVKRSWAGSSAGPVLLREMQWQQTKAAGGLVPLSQPFQLYPGDIVRWRCSYDTSDVPQGSSLAGGYSSAAGSLQEQCTVVLHYWPRVESMRGCSAATLTDKLLGENMCSSEAEDILQITGQEAQQFPMRRMYNEHSFPKSSWMGAWKATHIILLVAVVWSVLWASHTMLSKCKALGSWHRRFHQLAPGQQRNVSLYIMHLILDTAVLVCVFQPMIELWLGLTETTADVRAGVWGFTYLVACYALELTWRLSVDTMLAVHHIGTITIILLYAGELTPYTYRVANNLIVLAAFALLEQPTYIALLFKRMLPAHSPAVVVAARVSFISWFAAKGASILIAASMFVEDWHLMPTWIRVNFLLTWLVASLVQGWSGMIQYGIYRQIKRNYYKAVAAQQEALLCAPSVYDDDRSSEEGDQGNLSPLLSSDGSEEDCIAAVDDAVLDDGGAGAFAKCSGKYEKYGSPSLLAAEGSPGGSNNQDEQELSPTSSGSGASDLALVHSSSTGSEEYVLLRTSSQGSQRQVRLQVPGLQSPAGEGHRAGAASGSSSAMRQACRTLQRRTRSGLLNLMECGVSCQDD